MKLAKYDWKVLKNRSNEIRTNEIHTNEIRLRRGSPVYLKIQFLMDFSVHELSWTFAY